MHLLKGETPEAMIIDNQDITVHLIFIKWSNCLHWFRFHLLFYRPIWDIQDYLNQDKHFCTYCSHPINTKKRINKHFFDTKKQHSKQQWTCNEVKGRRFEWNRNYAFKEFWWYTDIFSFKSFSLITWFLIRVSMAIKLLTPNKYPYM